MKKTYKYAVIGVLSLLLAGCEDFLDKREDSGGLTEDAVYSSYESIRGFLDQVYPKLEAYNTFEGADDGKNQRTYVGVMGDEMSATYNKTAFAKFFSGSWLTTDKAANVAEVGNGNNTPVGKALPAIRIVNRVIANIDKVPLTGEQRNEILGQAYFYRVGSISTLSSVMGACRFLMYYLLVVMMTFLVSLITKVAHGWWVI